MGKSFRFDFLRKIIDQVEVEEPSCSGDCEAYRQALQGTVEKYVKEYFPAGVIAVYGKQEGSGMLLTACIEDHKFSPPNFWNGKWRSEWKIRLKMGKLRSLAFLRLRSTTTKMVTFNWSVRRNVKIQLKLMMRIKLLRMSRK